MALPTVDGPAVVVAFEATVDEAHQKVRFDWTYEVKVSGQALRFVVTQPDLPVDMDYKPSDMPDTPAINNVLSKYGYVLP